MSLYQRPALVHPDFGGIECFGSYWQGTLVLNDFEKPFRLIVRAKQEGPSSEQATAMSTLVTSLASIRRAATAPMTELHRESELLPDPAGMSGDRIWSYLEPEQIEVSDARYYRNGNGSIAILLIFNSTQNMDFSPAIETTDGRFRQVLSGT
ncbi:hypothetical protein EAH89_13455 [Roseomonas nepalensis]|uniref:Uncharacterized protein n=1 Tax=Muricoccus nepalensis TaxID=1854500 RepID=A0A502G2A0_9PROT|nr:hypothetical protein [Roseomonas nepalensis]TPG55939.1 hypothetical protein EAH89_13455 [Roseomonas nepalensis]